MNTATRLTADPTTTIDALPRLAPSTRSALLERSHAEPGRDLVVRDGDEERLLRLAAGVTHVGRGLSADVRLDDETVSRRHAILVNRTRALRILDDRSANGTFVNGRRVTSADLGDADVIVLGRVSMTYIEITAFS